MKRLLFLLGMASLCEAKSIVTDELIDKFAVIESNYDYNAVGDKGKALGAWQMHKPAFDEALTSIYRRTGHDWRSVWTYDRKLFSYPATSRLIAREYMLILEKQFNNLGEEVTPIKLYMAWNMGFCGAKACNFHHDNHNLDAKRASILKRANYILSR